MMLAVQGLEILTYQLQYKPDAENSHEGSGVSSVARRMGNRKSKTAPSR